MSDPFIPSGRELDEGLDPRRRKTRFGRLLDKVTPAGRREKSRVRALRLTVQPGVGERQAVADGRPEPFGASPAETGTQDAGQAFRDSADTVDEISAALGVSVYNLCSVIVAAGSINASGEVVDRCLGESQLANGTRNLISWLADIHGLPTGNGRPSWHARSDHASLPGGVYRVLAFITSIENSDRLGEYRRSLDVRREAEAAIRRLDGAAVKYPGLAQLARQLRRGDTSGVERHHHYGSAAWMAAHTEIAEAETIVRAAGPATMNMPLLPRTPTQGMLARDAVIVDAVLHRIEDIPTRRRGLEKSLAEVRNAALARRDKGMVVSWLERHGIEFDSAKPVTPSPRQRRRAVSLPPAKPEFLRADRNYGPAGGAPGVNGLRICRRCRTAPADRGALCDGCADVND